MKKLVFILVSLATIIDVQAQENISTVTLTVAGNNNLQVAIDGISYSLLSDAGAANRSTITINTLQTGQHSFQITRTAQRRSRSERINSSFNLRYGYNMRIKVNQDGSLEIIETKIPGIVDNPVPMNNANFNVLLQNVRNQRTTVARRTVITNAFNNTANYFTSSQATQLIQQVNGENFRLELAKLSYRSITDQQNFYMVYDLLNSQVSREELQDYVDNYFNDSDLHFAMTDADFNVLYRTIQQQRPASVQVNSLTNAFNNTDYYFTAYQAKQLIQLVYGEAPRLQLAKLSYRSIIDPVNFSQLYTLFTRQASKDELAAYVSNYNQEGNNGVAMSDADFNALYRTIQQQWPASTQMNSLTSAFNNTSNYFTTYQARQLIQLVNGEANRLQLAKLSYRSITDRGNFSQVYNLLNNQSSKDELTAYINNYNVGGNNNGVGMSDTDFNALYQSLQLKFFPNEKMNSLTDLFTSTSSYFSCAQAKQLIALVSLETNRLQLAKLCYRTIVDRGNFTQLYDLLSSQASRNELDAYVRGYRD